MRGAIKRYHQRQSQSPFGGAPDDGGQSRGIIRGNHSLLLEEHLMRGAIKRYHQRRVSGSLSGHQPLWGDRTSALSSPLVRNQSRNQSSSMEIAPRPCRAPWYAISHAIKAHQGRSHLGLVEPLDARGEHANKRPDGAPPACSQRQSSVAIIIDNHQWQSVAISGNQWQHASISGPMAPHLASAS